MVRLTFHGAAETVTGSKYLLEADRRRVLVDCGLFQGLKELRLMNWQPLASPPAKIQAVVLTHAHIDHVGYLPRFVSDGFPGPIYCTPATADLSRSCCSTRPRTRKKTPTTPIAKALETQAGPAAVRCRRRQADLAVVAHRARGEWFSPAEPIWIRYHDAGHLLGSSHDRSRNSRSTRRCGFCFPATSAATMPRCITIRPRRRRATI